MRRSRLKIILLYFAPQFSVYTKFGIDPIYFFNFLLDGEQFREHITMRFHVLRQPLFYASSILWYASRSLPSAR